MTEQKTATAYLPAWDEQRRNWDFLHTHFLELREKYPNQWVGAYQGEIVADGDCRQSVLDEIERQGIPGADIAALFMRTGPLPSVWTPLRVGQRRNHAD